jgi:hypothetical protein
MQLTQVRATLEAARATFGAEPALRRAFTHGLTAIDRWLEQPGGGQRSTDSHAPHE